jgi:alpha-N-arabinofuranosidase
MKKLLALVSLLFPLALYTQTAKIKIDIDRTIGEIDPKIYGVFMEPVKFNPKRFGLDDTTTRNTLYGTLYDPASPLADANGFRTDYIEAARELGITNMRWPGGNYVAGYNWQDGIGPKDQRPIRKDLAWGAIDNNQVGTDEWVQLNRSIGSENVVCINLGTGTINDARYWVEYCNSSPGSYYADLRARYGNPKPFNIKYWCLGNEVDGEPWIMGYKNAEDYCKIAKEVAKVMRHTDNSIQLVANGSSNYDPYGKWVDWNWKIITEMRNVADYISIHRYWENSDDYYIYMGQRAMDIEDKITVPAAQIELVRTQYHLAKPLYISFDEWAPYRRDFLSVLAVAQYFNAFIRHADVVKMANFTFLTSILGYDREKGTYKTPLFHTFKLFSNNCRGTSVDVFVECDTFNAGGYKGIPYLDVTSVYSEETNTLVINVVNRHKEEPITAEIQNISGTITGKAQVSEVNSSGIHVQFTFDKQQDYIPVTRELTVKENMIRYSFPAHSFTQIRVKTGK